MAPRARAAAGRPPDRLSLAAVPRRRRHGQAAEEVERPDKEDRLPPRARLDAARPAPRGLIDGMEAPAFTLGVEEEFQILDPETRELRSHVQEILDEGKLVLKERVKPEMHQSVIEIGTGICKNIAEVRQDVGEMRTEIIRLAIKNGMRVASAGTHPFSNWADQKIFPDPALRQGRRGDAAARAGQPDLRPARPRRHQGPVARVPDHERGAVLPAAPAGALDELPVLARAQHGVEELSARRSSTGSRARACRSTSRRRRSSTNSSASSSRPIRSTTARRSGGTSARTRSSRRSSSASATCRCGSTRP